MSADDYILDEESRKMLQTLFDNPEKEFNKAELARESGVSRDALYRRWSQFEDMQIVKNVDGRFTLNKEAQVSHYLQVIMEESERVQMCY